MVSYQFLLLPSRGAKWNFQIPDYMINATKSGYSGLTTTLDDDGGVTDTKSGLQF